MKRVFDDIAVTFARVGRRRSGPRRLAVSGWRLAVAAVLAVVGPTLVTPPAAAQNQSVWLSWESDHPVESAREVELTVTLWRAGRVDYRTFDGNCEVRFGRAGGAPNPNCSDGTKKATAPDDYTATSGELVFTTGGSQTISIPIANDEVAEGTEAFTLAAWEQANADPWIDRGDRVVIHINDDEVGPRGGNSAAPAARSSTNTTPAGGQSSGSAVGAGAADALDPASPTSATPPADELRAGPPSELTREGGPESAPDPGGGGGGSTSGLAIVAGIAALGVGALAVMRRRRRLSATEG